MDYTALIEGTALGALMAGGLTAYLGSRAKRRCQAELARLDGEADIEAVWSNGTQGNFIISCPPAGLANAGVREWWQRTMAGDDFVSPVYISALTRRPCLTVSVPIRRATRCGGYPVVAGGKRGRPGAGGIGRFLRPFISPPFS